MDQNEKDEDNISILSSSSSECDGYPAMPNLSLIVQECDYPQNLNNRRRKLQFDSIQKWSYRNETSSSSGNDSPPPLSPLFNAKSASLSPCLSSEHASDCHSDTIPSVANQKKKENEAVVPYLRRQYISVPSVLRRSSRLKIDVRKSTRPHRYCTSAGLGFKCTKKKKPVFTKLRKPRSRPNVNSVDKVRNAETDESLKSYEVDDIDGFLIWSFATATELGNFSTEQLSRNQSTKATSNSPLEGSEADEKVTSFVSSDDAIDGLQTKKSVVLDSYPSGAVLPIGGNVTEESESEKCRSKEPSTSSSSIQQEETADSVVENKKIVDSPRKKLKSFPKVPTHFRTRNETLTRLRIQNKILKKKLAKALKDRSDRKLDRTNGPVPQLKSPASKATQT